MSDSEAESSAKLAKFMTRLVSKSLDLAGSLKFSKDNPSHVYAISLYGSLIEISAAIDTLADAKQITGIPILLRALLEAHASFRCCASDPNHFKSLYASFAKERLRMFRHVEGNPENPYLHEIDESVDVKAKISEVEKELADLKAAGAVPLSTYDEFRKAGLLSEYQSIYWQLCLHAHNNISMLERRHLEKKSNGDFEVAFFQEPKHGDLVRYLDTAAGLLVESSSAIHDLFKSGQKEKTDELAKELDGIRAHYPSKQPASAAT